MIVKYVTLAVLAAPLLAFSPSASASGAAHWGYHGEGGPAHWGDLDHAFQACKAGAMQSPIDLSSANTQAVVGVSVDYKPVALNVLHNGHTVQFNVDNGSTAMVGGKPFKLLQVHFHTPSEHVDKGTPYPLEAHFVHKSDDGKLAVIGVFFVPGAENKALTPLFAHLPTKEAAAQSFADAMIDPAAVLPADRKMVRYMGSLTTPPCSEGVNWMVMKAPVTASKAQIEALHQAMGDNARPAQAPGNRLIVAPE